MSDQTNPAGGGDFRGSAADKRKDETVMVSADDLENLVANARQDAAVPPQPTPPAAPAASVAPVVASNGPSVALIAGIVGVIALIAIIIAVVMVVAS